jgi:hypothetical protein
MRRARRCSSKAWNSPITDCERTDADDPAMARAFGLVADDARANPRGGARRCRRRAAAAHARCAGVAAAAALWPRHVNAAGFETGHAGRAASDRTLDSVDLGDQIVQRARRAHRPGMDAARTGDAPRPCGRPEPTAGRAAAAGARRRGEGRLGQPRKFAGEAGDRNGGGFRHIAPARRTAGTASCRRWSALACADANRACRRLSPPVAWRCAIVSDIEACHRPASTWRRIAPPPSGFRQRATAHGPGAARASGSPDRRPTISPDRRRRRASA